MPAPTDYTRGPRCGIDNCPSRLYILDEDSGYTLCSNGHRSSASLVSTFDDAPTAASQVTRAERQSSDTQSSTKTLSGREALVFFLTCYQRILISMVEWLVKERGFKGDELEQMVKSLWSVRLCMLGDAGFDEGDVNADDDGRRKTFSSQGESQEQKQEESSGKKLNRMDGKDMPRLRHSIGFLYLACLLLRLPVSVRDFDSWVQDTGFPYLNIEGIVSPKMLLRLPVIFRRYLRVQTGAPDPGQLHRMTMQMAEMYLFSQFEMHVPPLNHVLLLFRFVCDLGLPLDVMPAVDKLAVLLKCNFSFSSQQKKYVYLADHPELQLVGLLMIIVKLFYPFDSIQRFPRTRTEPAVLHLDWQAWKEAWDKTSAQKQESMKGQAAFLDLKDEDVFRMTGKQLDDYMDWYQRTWMDDEEELVGTEIDFRRALFKMFPVPSLSKDNELDFQNSRDDFSMVKAVHESLSPNEILADDEEASPIARPGEQYAQYRETKDLPETAKSFYDAVAKITGVSIEILVFVVFHMEMKVQHWTKKQQRPDRKLDRQSDDDHEYSNG